MSCSHRVRRIAEGQSQAQSMAWLTPMGEDAFLVARSLRCVRGGHGGGRSGWIAPGLMETSLTRKDGRQGRTTEVPRRAARASHKDGDRCARGPGHSSRRVPLDREQLGDHPEAVRTWVKK